MDSHENARSTPRGRLLMVERLQAGWATGEVAAAAGVTAKTVRKWRDRFAAEGEHPGELIHLDIKKLGRIDGIGHRITGDRTGQSSKRGTGWEYLHVAIDDASRLAFTAIMPNEKKKAPPPSSSRPWPGSAPMASPPSAS